MTYSVKLSKQFWTQEKRSGLKVIAGWNRHVIQGCINYLATPHLVRFCQIFFVSVSGLLVLHGKVAWADYATLT